MYILQCISYYMYFLISLWMPFLKFLLTFIYNVFFLIHGKPPSVISDTEPPASAGKVL